MTRDEFEYVVEEGTKEIKRFTSELFSEKMKENSKAEMEIREIIGELSVMKENGEFTMGMLSGLWVAVGILSKTEGTEE